MPLLCSAMRKHGAKKMVAPWNLNPWRRPRLILVYGQLVDHGGIVFNHFFRSPLLARDGGFDRGAVQQHFLFGHPLNTPVIVFIQHTTEAPGIPPSEEFSYAFRSPLWRVLDNLSCLSVDHAGKALKWLAYYRPKCVDRRRFVKFP